MVSTIRSLRSLLDHRVVGGGARLEWGYDDWEYDDRRVVVLDLTLVEQ